MLILTFEKIYKQGKTYESERREILGWLHKRGNILDVRENMLEMKIDWSPDEKVTVHEMIEWKRKLRAFWLAQMQ